MVDAQLTSARHGFESRPNVNLIKLFFSAIAFTAAFLQISHLKFYNYGNLILRVLNFAIVVRRYFAGLHIRDFNARPATIKRRHAMRTNFFFWLGSDRTI